MHTKCILVYAHKNHTINIGLTCDLQHMTAYKKIIANLALIFCATVLTLYTGSGLYQLFPTAPHIASIYEYTVWAAVMILLLARFLESRYHQLLRMMTYLLSGVFIIALGQVIYSSMLLLWDILYWTTWHNTTLFNRIGLCAAVLFFIACIDGSIWGKYRYTVHKKTLRFSDLPSAFDGFRIVQISDIHSGSFDDIERVQRGIDIVKEQDADLFVFTGDLVNNSAHEFRKRKPLFWQITAPYGQYSILWNHDYGDYVSWPSANAKAENLALLKQNHADIGRRLILDEHILLEKDGECIALAGVENRWDSFSRYGDLQKALSGIEPQLFTVLLSHDPSHRGKEVIQHPKYVHLTLSWHTHAMQMWFHIGKFRRSPIKYRYKRRAGLYEHAEKYLYINKWFGFLWLSARVGMWPEITVITLKKKTL